MNLLLDTCVVLWLAGDPPRLSEAAVTAIDDPANQLYLSDASVWEIVLKHGAGKLPLPAAPREWISQQAAFFHLERQAIDHESLYRCGELPMFHRDPFDRLLAAQALAHGLTVVSPDAPFGRFGAKTCW